MLIERILELAGAEVGVREVGRNKGPRVDQYLASVGLPPGSPWCAAFCYFIVQRACTEIGRPTPLPCVASVHKMWNMVPRWYRVPQPAPGVIFFHDSGAGMGHTGFVEHVQDHGSGVTELVTIEGNTDESGGREGDGVYRRIRPPHYVNLGYIDLGMAPPSKLIVA